jgi:hypothetical protein
MALGVFKEQKFSERSLVATQTHDVEVQFWHRLGVLGTRLVDQGSFLSAKSTPDSSAPKKLVDKPALKEPKYAEYEFAVAARMAEALRKGPEKEQSTNWADVQADAWASYLLRTRSL